MKCTCSKSDLKDALMAVSKAVAIKPQTPIIAGIYMRATGSELEIQATDFSLGVIAKIPANTEIDGAVVVVGKYISEIVSKLDGEIVTISDKNDDNVAVFKSEAAAFTLPTMNAEEFPKVKTQDTDINFRIQPAVFKNLVRYSAFACAKDESRPIFTGCCIDIKGKDITFAATNTHRIAIAKGEIIDDIGECKIVVPSGVLRHISSMLENFNTDKPINIDCSSKHIDFTVDNVFVSSRLIDGEFPPYEKVIPPTTDTIATIEVADLRRAVERISIISKQTDYDTIRFNFMQEGLEISADSYGVGKAEEHVDADVEGPELDISFNVGYISDILKVISGKNLKFGMTKPLSPVDIREEGNDEFIYIVTPVRTRN